MNIKIIPALSVFIGSLLSNPGDGQKLLSYLRRINDHLIIVVDSTHDKVRQEQHVAIAKQLVTDAIQNENITDSPALYSIGGMLFDDPVYAARAIELEKGKGPVRRTTQQLERRTKEIHEYGESYLSRIKDSIEECEMQAMRASLSGKERAPFESKINELEKTKTFVTAQLIAQGALQKSLYLYRQTKEGE